VKTGDKLSLGFEGTRVYRGADAALAGTMFAYLTGRRGAVQKRRFRQHYASEKLFNDLVDQAELYQEALKYYANILTPFSRLVDKKIKEVVGLNLPVAMIAPATG
jgi:flavorubredoxin